MSVQHVLVVDDELQVIEVFKLYLRREGFHVATVTDGEMALAAFEAQAPDLVVLDLMLPKIDGLHVFKQLRAKCAVPIIMLTAKGDEIDRVLGLELGADDYIVKPFSPREVVARVKNVLRRAAPSEDSESALTYGELRIDPRTRGVQVGSRKIDLTGKKFDLLYFLAKHPEQVFTRAQLLDQVWGYKFFWRCQHGDGAYPPSARKNRN